MRTSIRTLMVLTMILLACTQVFSQENEAGGDGFFTNWVFGVKAGISLSNMYGDVGDNSFLIFPHLGAVLDKGINDQLTISAEPHFSGEGQDIDGNAYERVIYLNLPFLAKFNVSEQLSVDGGVHFGIKLTERTKFENGDTRNRNRYSPFAPGITAGPTYNIDEDWFVQGRVNYKISDVIRDGAGDSEGSSILTFQVSIGRRI